MMTGLLALAGRLERKRSLLGLAKLGNVGLGMIWGFVVTFVFVRILPFDEFRTFLLLVAFANFTISAELGFSSIIYARLRRSRLAEDGDFNSEELGVLLLFMLGIVGIGAVILLSGLGFGLIETNHPVLFMAFYLTSALNLVTLLARRALAALDHNLWWEALDFVRRSACVFLLLGALFGLSILLVVLLQLVLTVGTILLGLLTVHRELGMANAHWWSLRSGWSHVWQEYLGDIGRTGLLTISDIAAYNAPYFTIVAATADPRPLLLFDFIFKFSRAITGFVRALVETMLPDLTQHFHAGARLLFSRDLRRCVSLAMVFALALSLFLIAAGPVMSRLLYDGKIELEYPEILFICAINFGLAIICVSVFLHNALGQFAVLVPPSLGLLCGSLLSVPTALMFVRWAGAPMAISFAACYAVAHLAMAALHLRLMRRIGGRLAS